MLMFDLASLLITFLKGLERLDMHWGDMFEFCGYSSHNNSISTQHTHYEISQPIHLMTFVTKGITNQVGNQYSIYIKV